MNKLTLLQQMDFCIQELTLYLDTHPNDLYAFRLLKRHLADRDQLKMEVERKNGPLTNYDTANNWLWTKGPWPWENEVNHHVDL